MGGLMNFCLNFDDQKSIRIISHLESQQENVTKFLKTSKKYFEDIHLSHNELMLINHKMYKFLIGNVFIEMNEHHTDKQLDKIIEEYGNKILKLENKLSCNKL